MFILMVVLNLAVLAVLTGFLGAKPPGRVSQ
jgi:hypothetical protein